MIRINYKHIRMIKVFSKTTLKTTVWRVVNKDDIHLGRISWYGAWRQYCLFPENAIIFNTGCLEDINLFIKKLTDHRKKEKKK